METVNDRYDRQNKNCRIDDRRGNSTSMMEQMMSLPFNMMSSGMDMMMNAMRGGSRSRGSCWDAMVSRVGHASGSCDDSTFRSCDSQRSSGSRWGSGSRNYDDTSSCRDYSDRYSSRYNSSCDSGRSSSRDSYSGGCYGTSDSGLKLVRYKILFVKRDLESVLEQRDELVVDQINENDFASWKTAEFIGRLRNLQAPAKWVQKSYPQAYANNAAGPIMTIPSEDQKYLRVHFEVVARYPREAFKYEEREVGALEGVRDAINQLKK